MRKTDTAEIIPLFQDGELAVVPSPLVQQAYDLWNEFAKANKWQIAMVLDTGRRSALKRAVSDYGGIIGFRANLEKIQRSDWCMGRVPPKEGYKRFQASLDWFVRPVTVRKVIENFYNGVEPVTAAPSAGRIQPVAMNWRAILETYRVGKYWPAMQGNRPEGPGPHLAPADMVDAWRKKHGVTGMQGHNGPPQESLEERLRASIEGYRRIGRYEDANRVENKLAALLGRPAVHVPSPETASFGMPNRPTSEPMPVSQKATRKRAIDISHTDASPPPWEPDGEPIGDYEVEADD